MRPKPIVGLALGGGGLRSAAHIGVLKVLEAEGININLLAGTSGGSIVGALYAAGLPLQQIEEFYRTFPQQLPAPAVTGFTLIITLLERCGLLPRRPTTQALSLPRGLLKSDLLRKLVNSLTRGLTFDRLQVPLAVLATDLLSGREVVFAPEAARPYLGGSEEHRVLISDESLGVAVAASSAIPGIFVPVRVGRSYLVDGGLKANVPVHLLSAWGAQVIVAVDLGFAVEESPIGNIFQVLLQAHDIMGQTISDLYLKACPALVIRPKVGAMRLVDFDRIPQAIDKGATAAMESLPLLELMLMGRS